MKWLFILLVGCTFDVKPVIEVQDANINLGPIQICPPTKDAGEPE